MKQKLFFLSLLWTTLFFCCAEPLIGQTQENVLSYKTADSAAYVTPKIFADMATIKPNSSFWILITYDIAPGWHLYWKEKKNPELVPAVQWTIPEGFKVGDAQFPPPEKIDIGASSIFGYTDTLSLLFQVQTPATLAADAPVSIVAALHWVACSTACVPGEAQLSLELPVEKNAVLDKTVASLFERAEANMPRSGAVTQLQDMRIHIEIPSSQVESKAIKNVAIFSEDGTYFDSAHTLQWKINSQEQLIITGAESVANTIQGLLVIDEMTPIGMKRSSWNISFQEGNSLLKRRIQSAEHIETLEQQVWYRKIFDIFNEAEELTFGTVLLFAFVGGLILNVMPCVLPIVSLKVFQFVKLAETGRKTVAIHGLFYSLGIIFSFWLLAAGMFALQAAGNVVGWGFQLQEPLFVAALVLLLFALALSLFGVYEFGIQIASHAANLEYAIPELGGSKGLIPSFFTSFFSGILATFVASPCTGPLLGSALGFAITLSIPYAFVLFTVVGAGMAFPYLLLSCFPVLIRLVPRPGPWMNTFKQLMGFLLIATLLWLLWVLQAEVPALSLIRVLVALSIIASGLWVFGNWGGLTRNKRVRAFAQIIAAVIFFLGAWMFFSDIYHARDMRGKETLSEIKRDWIPFSSQKLQELRDKHTPVFVEFTARWCLTCQAGKLVLDRPEIMEAFKKHGVVLMLADWTAGDPEITAFLRSIGRSGVPVYALYGKEPEKPPTLLPELLTKEAIFNALEHL